MTPSTLSYRPRWTGRRARAGGSTSTSKTATRWLIPRECADFWGCGWSSRPRTQAAGLAGGKAEAEDTGRRRSDVPSSGAWPWNQPSSAAAAMTPLLSLRNVSKSYPDGGREIPVLDSVWLEIEARASVGVYGTRRARESPLCCASLPALSPRRVRRPVPRRVELAGPASRGIEGLTDIPKLDVVLLHRPDLASAGVGETPGDLGTRVRTKIASAAARVRATRIRRYRGPGRAAGTGGYPGWRVPAARCRSGSSATRSTAATTSPSPRRPS